MPTIHSRCFIILVLATLVIDLCPYTLGLSFSWEPSTQIAATNDHFTDKSVPPFDKNTAMRFECDAG